MSNFAAISATANNVTANGFPEFPGENQTKVQLEEWIEAWDEDMNQAGFDAFTRDELPYDVAKLVRLRGRCLPFLLRWTSKRL